MNVGDLNNREHTYARYIGFTGLVAGCVALLLDMFVVRKTKSQQRQGHQISTASMKDLVQSCSWWYVAGCFLVTTLHALLWIIYVIVPEYDLAQNIGYLTFPISVLCIVLSVFLRPKDNGGGINILHFQFFVNAGVGETIHAVGELRQEDYFVRGTLTLCLIPVWCAFYIFTIRLF